METKKIFILSVPAFGHIHPILAVAKKLLQISNIKIIIFGTNGLKKIIEDTG